MTIEFQRIAPGANLLDEDDVLPTLRLWRQQGLRTVLVTLVGVEGGAPRQPGAQMAVAEDGRYVGYLSGGCLEQAVALEAQDVAAKGINRLVRYGRGSPYFDIKLPCGSGLDLYFDQSLEDAALQTVLDNRAARRATVLETDLDAGASAVSQLAGAVPLSCREGGVFKRVYPVPIRLALIGNGPAVSGISTLARHAGLDVVVWSSDDAIRAHLMALGVELKTGDSGLQDVIQTLDQASAAVLVFHDHDVEPAIAKQLLETPAFYLGILGNRAVHRARCEQLVAMGVEQTQIERLHAPVGSIANAKSKATFAFGVLTEMLSAARACNLIS